MNAILDAVKRLRAGLVLSAAMVAAGCAEKAEEPFVDPEFDLLLFLEPGKNSLAGSAEPSSQSHADPEENAAMWQLVTSTVETPPRFGGDISYDPEHDTWIDIDGNAVDLSETVETGISNFPGTTSVRLAPQASIETVIRALARLAEAGICEFDRIDASGVLEGKFAEPVTYDEYGDSNLIVAYRLPGGPVMKCREGKKPQPAKAGYSLHSSFCTLSDIEANRGKPHCVY